MSLPPRPNNIGVIYQQAGAVHVGVDYDCVDQTVYWTEVTKGVIVRTKYDGSDMEVIVQKVREKTSLWILYCFNLFINYYQVKKLRPCKVN